MNINTINAEHYTMMKQALQKIAAMEAGEYETEVECPHPTMMECDTCTEMQDIAREVLETLKLETVEGGCEINLTEELINAGYNQENPVPYHEPVETGKHRMFIFGYCVGVALTERGENDPHVVITYLVGNDGFWAVLSGPISAYWLNDMIALNQYLKDYLKHSGHFETSERYIGYEWRA